MFSGSISHQGSERSASASGPISLPPRNPNKPEPLAQDELGRRLVPQPLTPRGSQGRGISLPPRIGQRQQQYGPNAGKYPQ
eukprot:gene8613-1539_t